MDRYRLSLHQGNIMEVVNATLNANFRFVSLAIPYFTKTIVHVPT